MYKECFLIQYYIVSTWRFADMAQLAEQLICNQQVIGSIPIVGLFISDL